MQNSRNFNDRPEIMILGSLEIVIVGKYLHGFENWDAVEGRLIHFTICTMLFWLGLVDLASDEENSLPCAFRLTTWAKCSSQQPKPYKLIQKKMKKSQFNRMGKFKFPDWPRV